MTRLRWHGRHAIDIGLIDAVNRVTHQASLPVRDDYLQPTVAFLRSLAQTLSYTWRRPVTLSVAWQVWHATYAVCERERIKHERDAELAFWFSVNPIALTGDQRIGLAANLERVKAQDRLNTGNYDQANPDQVHALVLLATGDEQAALKARADSIRLVMERECR